MLTARRVQQEAAEVRLAMPRVVPPAIPWSLMADLAELVAKQTLGPTCYQLAFRARAQPA